MSQVSFNVDIAINIETPILTRRLGSMDKSRLGETGAFNFQPRPQVETSSPERNQANFKEGQEDRERFEQLDQSLEDLLKRIAKREEFMRKKCGHLYMTYDPSLAENESISEAEETLFGFASGKITYAMYEAILEFEQKINTWISQKSIDNGGALNGIA